MSDVHTKFTNEIGHEIQLSIVQNDQSDVVIVVEGPDSLTENILTKMEAHELFYALGHVLYPTHGYLTRENLARRMEAEGGGEQ